MRVTRYNYAHQFHGDLQHLTQELTCMLATGNYVLGPRVEAFERHFAEYLGVDHVIGVNSGTDALLLALMGMGIGPGDEVITQANTFHATVAAVCLVGAKPVLVDVDPATFLMDVAKVETRISAQTKVILPVHLYGKPTPMDDLLQLASHYNLGLLEDAAQSHGAKRSGKRTGSFGIAGCFSFHPSKNLAAAGDAGAISTSDPELATALRLRRELGQQTQNHHVVVGLNSKLDAIQARILDFKLPLLDAWNAGRARIADGYRERLADTPLNFQAVDLAETHVYHLFQVRTPQRDALIEWLNAREIDVSIRYPTPIHLQPAFRELGYGLGAFPVAEALARELLCLPIRPDMCEDELDYVSDCIHAFFRSRG